MGWPCPDTSGPDAARVSLELDRAPGQPVPCGVRVLTRDPGLLSGLVALAEAGALPSVLRVSVASGNDGDDTHPPVSGRHQAGPDGLLFTPFFPFAAGLRHRASFDPRPIGWPGRVLTLEFSRPADRGASPELERIFPSAEELPENLLRFHLCFSQPMRRGLAGTEVRLLGSGGRPVSDALYRAPVELWDRDMRRLTVLLDPGRLKREVGPNRALGPPLRAGRAYALAVGAGMAGWSGRHLAGTVLKRFRATAPVRAAITTADWDIVAPAAGSREPLLLRLDRPLDWGLLREAVTVADAAGRAVDGRLRAGCRETELGFMPDVPWAAGPHLATVSAGLEDVCGNGWDGAFDRPLRRDDGRTGACVTRAFSVHPR